MVAAVGDQLLLFRGIPPGALRWVRLASPPPPQATAGLVALSQQASEVHGRERGFGRFQLASQYVLYGAPDDCVDPLTVSYHSNMLTRDA